MKSGSSISEWLSRWVAPRSRNEWEALRERVIYALNLPLIVLFLILSIIDGVTYLSGQGAFEDLIADLFALISMTAVYAITRRGWIRLGSISLLVIYLDIAIFYVLREGFGSANAVLFIVAIIASGLALGANAGFVVATIATVVYALAAALQVRGWTIPGLIPPSFEEILVFAIFAYLGAGLIAVFGQSSKRSMRNYARALHQQWTALQASDHEKKLLLQSLHEQTNEQRQLSARLQASNDEQDALRSTLQQAATPVIPVLEQVVIVPITSDLHQQPLDEMLQHVLDQFERHSAHLAIFDLTEMPGMDGYGADGLIRLVKGASLLGIECVLVGIRPAAAKALLDLGVDLSALTGKRDLQSAIEYALARTGRRIVAVD
ncbi:MAG: STAS domain-containing protein [Anaerolineae bacterium]|jgi:rsbT co-antagonist protein RsbR